MRENIIKIIVTLAVLAAIVAVIAAKQLKVKTIPQPDTNPKVPQIGTENDQAETKLPRLLELGSVSCIPCKAMKPILDELEVEYKGSMAVEFIDVWKDESAGKKYGIKSIPTQIFFDADGKELFRHVGFFSKEAILAKWTELGVDLDKAK